MFVQTPVRNPCCMDMQVAVYIIVMIELVKAPIDFLLIFDAWLKIEF
jgi:hypothetical protein